VIRGWIASWINIHNSVAKLSKWRSLERLGKKICKHFFGGTIFNNNLALCNPICHEKIAYIDVSGPTTAGSLAVLL
jgi:hypothetical protein